MVNHLVCLRTHLNRLDALMHVSCRFSIVDIDWHVVLLKWRNMKDFHILEIDRNTFVVTCLETPFKIMNYRW